MSEELQRREIVAADSIAGITMRLPWNDVNNMVIALKSHLKNEKLLPNERQDYQAFLDWLQTNAARSAEDLMVV